jgi:hypothetical protein
VNRKGLDRESAPLPAPKLLGPFEPLLLGWVSREAFVGSLQIVVTNNGLFVSQRRQILNITDKHTDC